MTPTVAYITGWSRSGSTLLGDLLGSMEGCVSVGELRDIWQVGIIEDQPCGCGVRFSSCGFWNSVLERFRASGHEVDAHAMVRVQRDWLRVRHSLPLVLAPQRRLEANEELARYAEVMSALYDAIAGVSGASVVVDSSKYPADGALIRLVVETVYLHLVRDPRAVAHSWRRVKLRQDRNRAVTMPRYGPVFSTANWLVFNALSESLRLRSPEPVQLVRYEDLVSRPRVVLSDLASLVGRQGVIPVDEEGVARLRTSHTVNGNPGRLRARPVRISPDDEWRRHLDAGDRLVATALALPLLPRYGYPIRTRVRSSGA